MQNECRQLELERSEDFWYNSWAFSLCPKYIYFLPQEQLLLGIETTLVKNWLMLTCNNNSFLCTINKSSDSATAAPKASSSYFFGFVVSEKYGYGAWALTLWVALVSHMEIYLAKKSLLMYALPLFFYILASPPLLNWTNNKVHAHAVWKS